MPSIEKDLCIAPIGGCPLSVRASLVGSEEADTIVAALGGISATHRVTDTSNARGWWRMLAGPGRALDTRRIRLLGMEYAVIQESTLTTAEQARVLAGVLDALGIDRLSVLVGASYGGMVGLAFARDYSKRLGRLVVVSAAHRSDPMATAWRMIQRRIVKLGIEHGVAYEAAVLARALAMTTYRSREEFSQRFARLPIHGPSGFEFPVERYLLSRGEGFAREMSLSRFLRLSESIDLHDIRPEDIDVPAHFVAVRTDQLVTPDLMRELAARYRGPSKFSEIDSIYGHDAFLKEVALLTPILSSECRSQPS